MLKQRLKKCLLTVMTAVVVSMGLNLATPAFAADPPSDLMLITATAAQDRLFADVVCNTGPTSVTSITFSYSFTNFNQTMSMALPAPLANVTAADSGTFNDQTYVWTGLITSGQCMAIGFGGVVTGANGEVITHNAAIVSSVLGDSSINVDPNTANDTSTYVTAPITPDADMAISSRLLTSGAINAGSTVNYEVTISNMGLGAYIDSPSNQLPLGLYFVMPPGSTLGTIVDQITGDELEIAGCGQIGSTTLLGPGFINYPGIVAGCTFISTSPLQPGSSFKFTVPMTAGASFASGTTGVWAVAGADDAINQLFQAKRLTPGADVFDTPDNTFENLIYNGDPLQATINRCAGQAEVTTDGTACFRVSFQKLIYAKGFIVSDLVLDGGGTVADSDFRQLDDYTWEVIVKGIPQGKTLTLSLVPGSVQDYSAVMNGVSVLGENRVRFETTGTVLATLPETGTSPDYLTPIVFLIFGLVIVNRKKLATFS